MAQPSTASATQRYAVVTGANKGIGFEICRQLASSGIVVILTARDENKGLEAVQKLKRSGLSHHLLIFHQLDVLDPNSIASLADFVKTHFGKLDILPDRKHVIWDEISTQKLELAEDCLKTNYYGAKAMAEALAPLLQLSDSARIVNVSSPLALLQNIPNEWAKGLLSDVEKLSEKRVDEVLNQYLQDFKDGLLESKGWPTHLSAYTVAKTAMNAYTRILAKKYPNFLVNAVNPGFCRTDMSTNLGPLTAAEGAENTVRLALLPKDGPSGCFFNEKQIIDF